MREAARRAGISPALWTQNEQGYRKVTAGVVIPWRATDDKLAAMALVVGATPGQLEETGRDGAARILSKLIDAAPDPAAQLITAIQEDTLSDRQKRELIKLIEKNTDRSG